MNKIICILRTVMNKNSEKRIAEVNYFTETMNEATLISFINLRTLDEVYFLQIEASRSTSVVHRHHNRTKVKCPRIN